MSTLETLFYANSIVAILTAAMVILHRNPVVCALALAMHLCSVAAFFLLLSASFLFAVQIIVYAGAIMVLFLFVVMLLDPAGEGVAGRAGTFQMVGAILLSFVLLVAMARTMRGTPEQAARLLPDGFGQAREVGALLFSDYLLPFEVASILLLVAMIGSLYMGKKEIDR